MWLKIWGESSVYWHLGSSLKRHKADVIRYALLHQLHTDEVLIIGDISLMIGAQRETGSKSLCAGDLRADSAII